MDVEDDRAAEAMETMFKSRSGHVSTGTGFFSGGWSDGGVGEGGGGGGDGGGGGAN